MARPPLLPPPAPPGTPSPRLERRSLPRAARVAIAAIGCAIAFLFVLSRQSGPKIAAEPRLWLEDKLAVSEEDLKRRREVKPEDLRPRDLDPPSPPSTRPAPTQAATPEPGPSEDTLAERRRRRANDPNDVLARRKRSAPNAEPSRAAPDNDGDLYRRPMGKDSTAARSGSERHGSDERTSTRRLAAGTTLHGTLTVPFRLRGGMGSATAVVTLDRPVDTSLASLRGARVLGQACVTGDRVEIRFRKMVLLGGDEVSINAEAQATDGSFGLFVATQAESDEGSEHGGGSVLGEVATDAATDVVSDVLGVGIPGRAATS
jgi:hypothetical protein